MCSELLSLSFPILSDFWNLFINSLFNLTSFKNSAPLPINLFLLRNLHIYFPCFLQHPSPESSVHPVFTCCLFPGLKLMLELVLFQLLFEIHSLNTLSHNIVYFHWTLHRTRNIILPNPCTRCPTELVSIRGYWCNRSFVIIIKSYLSTSEWNDSLFGNN